MKLKKGTLILVSFVAAFFLGFSTLSAQQASADNTNSATVLQVDVFENHVKNYLPQSLTQYIVGNYESFSAKALSELNRIANEKTMVRSGSAMKIYFGHIEDWINSYVPSADRGSIMANLYQRNLSNSSQ